MITLTTDRLELRPIEPADLEELHEVFLDSAVRRFLLDDEEMPLAFTRQVIDDSIVGFESETGAGLWAVRELEQGERAPIVGFVGYREFFEPPELQLLYGLLPTVWGRGYATEASRAAIDFGFDECGFDEVIAATDPPNEASIRVMERLGFGHRVDSQRDGKPTITTRIRADEWQRLRAREQPN